MFVEVATLCRRDSLTVRRSDAVIKAAQLMRERHVGYLVVTEPNSNGVPERPVGILSDRDIVVAVVARKGDAGKITVGEIMTQPPVSVRATDSVEKRCARCGVSASAVHRSLTCTGCF
jgi:CBS domain-containing protein